MVVKFWITLMGQQDLLPFGQRLRDLRDFLGVSQKDFARSLTISGSYLSEIESGKVKANYDFFYNISLRYHVNLRYLLHGEGNMFTGQHLQEGGAFREMGGLGLKFEEMIDYMIRSPLVMVAMISHYTMFFYEHEETIKKDIEKKRRQRKPKVKFRQ